LPSFALAVANFKINKYRSPLSMLDSGPRDLKRTKLDSRWTYQIGPVAAEAFNKSMTGHYRGNVCISRTTSQKNKKSGPERSPNVSSDISGVLDREVNAIRTKFSDMSAIKIELPDVGERFKLEDVPAVIEKAQLILEPMLTYQQNRLNSQ
jgi:hypothetical protein